MFSHFADKVAFVNYLPLLTQATADDGEPTPGYLLGELKNITFQSQSSCQQLADYILHRLSKSSTNVKIKVFKIIIYLIQNGHVSFRQNLRQNDGPVKTAVLCSGPPDPLLGKSQYKEVQKLAQETLDILFDPGMIEQEENCGEMLTPLHPPKVFMGGMGAGCKSSGKYEGFGNTPRDREGTVADKMLDYLGRLIQPSEEQTHEVIRAALHSSPGNYQPVPVVVTTLEPVMPLNVSTQKISFKKGHTPGKAGGGWESDDDITDVADSKSDEDDSHVPTALRTSIASLDSIERLEHFPSDTIQKESEQVIENFCNSSGAPSLDELDEVVKKCMSGSLSDAIRFLAYTFSQPQNFTTNNYLKRALLLTEWLQHYDPLSEKPLIQGLLHALDSLVSSEFVTLQELKTKARKLSLMLHSIAQEDRSASE